MLAYWGRRSREKKYTPPPGGGGESQTYEGRDVLEAVCSIAILGDAHFVIEHETDLDDAGDTGGHESVAKSLVGHGADHEFLGVCGHGPAGDGDNKAGDEVALGRAVPVATEPDAG